MKFKSLTFLILLFVAFFLFVPTKKTNAVFHVDQNNEKTAVFEVGIPGQIEKNTPYKNVSLENYINFIYMFMIGLVGIAGFASLVWYGIIWIYSGISEKKSEASEGIKNTLIGIALALSSWVILNTINPDLVRIKAPSLETPNLREATGLKYGGDFRTPPYERFAGRFYLDYQEVSLNQNSKIWRTREFFSLKECNEERSIMETATFSTNNIKKYTNISPCKEGDIKSQKYYYEMAVLNQSGGEYSTEESCQQNTSTLLDKFANQNIATTGCIKNSAGRYEMKYGKIEQISFPSQQACERSRPSSINPNEIYVSNCIPY